MVASGAPDPPAVAPDSLWRMAIAVAATGDSVVPGFVDARVEQLDSDGRVENGKETLIRLFLGPDGKVHDETVKAIEYGKDPSDSTVSTGSQNEGSDEKEKQHQVSMSIGESPFRSAEGVEIEAHPAGERKSIEGRECAAYAFRRVQKKKTMSGTAWIEVSSGMPVEIQFTEDPLPKHVKRMMTTSRYAYDDSLGWRVREMSIEAVGGFLFIKKRFHVTTTFAEHWRLPKIRPLAQQTPAGPQESGEVPPVDPPPTPAVGDSARK
jgi:hypothetical protein